MLARPPHPGETSATIWGVDSRHVSPSPPEHRTTGHIRPHPPSHAIIRRRMRCQSRRERPSSRIPIRAKRSTLDSHTLPLNGEALSDRLALLPVPKRTADHPEQPVERGEQDGETGPEENDARVDDEQLHRELAESRAATTTAREPVLGAHATRVIERARKRDAIAESHFQSNLSSQVGWYVAVSHCCTVSHNVNTVLLQCAPDLFNLLLIHTTNANAAVNLTVTVLNNFELERDTVQAKNDFPTQ